MECHSHTSLLAGTASLLPLLSPLSSVPSIPGPLGLPTEGVPCATGKKGQDEPGEQGSGLGRGGEVSVWVSLCPECGMCLPGLQSCFLLGEHYLIHLLFYSHTFIRVFIRFFIHSPMPSGHLPKPS